MSSGASQVRSARALCPARCRNVVSSTSLPSGRPYPGQARPVQVPGVSSVRAWSSTWARSSWTQFIRTTPVRPMPVMPMAVIAVTFPFPGCTRVLSISRLPAGVAVQDALQHPGRGADLRLGRLQDRFLAWAGPGRNRLAEVAIIGVFGRDLLALPVRETAGERAPSGGQVV